MVSDLVERNGRLYSNELRKLAKAMNQRMLELERRSFKSPAYKSVQARLEALGRTAKTAQGRRFSETGYFSNKNEAAQIEAVLKRFKSQQTSTLKGYREYRSNVLEGLQNRYNYKQSGMTDDDMLEFWESMPDNERDRMYGSDETFLIISKYLLDKNQRKTEAENKKNLKGMSPEEKDRQVYIQRLDTYTMQEIVDIIQRQKSLTDALDALGIDTREYMNFKAGKIKGIGTL